MSEFQPVAAFYAYTDDEARDYANAARLGLLAFEFCNEVRDAVKHLDGKAELVRLSEICGTYRQTFLELLEG
jgi:hypothetical protein